MPIYQRFIRGENFLMNFSGMAEFTGFYATRFVEASNRISAEQLILGSLRRELLLHKQESNEPESRPAKVYFEEIDEVDEIGSVPGFTFFPEDT